MKIEQLTQEQQVILIIRIEKILLAIGAGSHYSVYIDSKNKLLKIDGVENNPPSEKLRKLVKTMLTDQALFKGWKFGNQEIEACEVHEVILRGMEEGQTDLSEILVTRANKTLLGLARLNAIELLAAADCHMHYTVLPVPTDGKSLIICENNKKPPTEKVRTFVKNLLKLNSAYTRIEERSTETMRGFFIGGLSEIQLNLRMLPVVKEAGINEYTWFHIPCEIRINWSQFNSALQEYLVNYVNSNISNIPHDLSTLPFSVRLHKPFTQTMDRSDSAPAARYNLLKLLAIKPDGYGKRMDPITGGYFNLEDLLPPDSGLSLIKQTEKTFISSSLPTRITKSTFVETNCSNIVTAIKATFSIASAAFFAPANSVDSTDAAKELPAAKM